MADTTRQNLKEKGIDTYLLVSVRGYNNRFKPSTKINDFEEEIKAGHLYPLYRESASNVTFTFTFYRDLKPVHPPLLTTPPPRPPPPPPPPPTTHPDPPPPAPPPPPPPHPHPPPH